MTERLREMALVAHDKPGGRSFYSEQDMKDAFPKSRVGDAAIPEQSPPAARISVSHHMWRFLGSLGTTHWLHAYSGQTGASFLNCCA